MTKKYRKTGFEGSIWMDARGAPKSSESIDSTDNSSEYYDLASEEPSSTYAKKSQTKAIASASHGLTNRHLNNRSLPATQEGNRPHDSQSSGTLSNVSRESSKSVGHASDDQSSSGSDSQSLFLVASSSNSPEVPSPLRNQPHGLNWGHSHSNPQDSDDSTHPEHASSSSSDIEIVSVVELSQNNPLSMKRINDTADNPKEKRLKPAPFEDSSSGGSLYKEGSAHSDSDSDSTGSSASDNSGSNLLATHYSTVASDTAISKVSKSLSENASSDESKSSDAPKCASGNKSDVVVIDSDSTSDVEEATPPSHDGPRSALHLLKNYGEEVSNEYVSGINTDAVSMHQLVGAADLAETYQFNFSIDVEYFLTFLHKDSTDRKRKVCFITGTPILREHPLLSEFRENFDISEAIVPLPHRYASHHSKMMVNFFDTNEVEIVIMTSNLTSLDLGGLNQSLWRSGRLSRGYTHGQLGNRFKSTLLRYLARYGMPTTKSLLSSIEKLDFSFVDVELVASAPGTYDLQDVSDSDEAYGFVKLRQVLKRNNLLIENTDVKHNIASQVTSIASPYLCQKGRASSVFSHLLCPLMFSEWRTLQPGSESFLDHQEDFNYKPHYVYPCIKDIAKSCFGYLSGSAVHYNYTGTGAQISQHEQNVKDYLYRWKTSGAITGREHVTPHSKYYVCDNGDGWKSLKWVLMGSHNLSKQAWGYPVAKSKGTKYEVSSYELSVLIPGGSFLIPTYKSDFLDNGSDDQLPLRLPFALPPTKYSPTDIPWNTTVDCGDRKDRYGNKYRGSS